MNSQLVLAECRPHRRRDPAQPAPHQPHRRPPRGRRSASVLLQNLSALKAELLRREAELSGQFGARHPRVIDLHNEKADLEGGSARRSGPRCAP